MTRRKNIINAIGNKFESWNKESIVVCTDRETDKIKLFVHKIGINAACKKERVLYLTNRLNQKIKLEEKIRTFHLEDYFKVSTYQSIETLTSNAYKTGFISYNYLICDNFQFFVQNCVLNKENYKALQGIVNRTLHDKMVTVFSGSSCDIVVDWLKIENKYKEENIYIQEDIRRNINNIYFYDKTNLFNRIDKIIDSTVEDKVLVFCTSQRIKEAYTFYKKDALYYHNNEDNLYVPISDNFERSQKRIIFTTNAICGEELRSRNIKHIFCEIAGLDEISQCIATKRIADKNDTIDLYFKIFNNGIFLSSRLPSFRNSLKYVNEYNLDPISFNEAYKTNNLLYDNKEICKGLFYYDENSLIKNSNIKINNLIYLFIKRYKEFWEGAKAEQYPYILLKSLEIDKTPIILPTEEPILCHSSLLTIYKNKVNKAHLILNFLNPYLDKKIYEEDKQLIKNEFERITGLKSSGIISINKYLDEVFENNFTYRLNNKDSSGKRYTETGGKYKNVNYWKFEKVIDINNETSEQPPSTVTNIAPFPTAIDW